MDFGSCRPARPAHRSRTPNGWRPSSLGLFLTLIASGATRGGDSPNPPTQEPAASHDGVGSEKARVATSPSENKSSDRVLDASHGVRKPEAHLESDPIARARQVIADCKARYQSVEDYTCTFFKRERVDGELYATHVMNVKARTKPSSLYFKFITPSAGREAIYVQGQNENKIVAHDVGLGRLVAGTMHLDPKGSMAMEENRHPVTEAGLGAMIDTVKDRWDHELHPGESVVLFHPQAKVGERPCLMVESIHPKPGKDYLFHKVKFYIDRELGLPIRFEAYNWPKHPGAEPELMEEYTYTNLRINVGLKDRDFDPNNKQYTYGRF